MSILSINLIIVSFYKEALDWDYFKHNKGVLCG